MMRNMLHKMMLTGFAALAAVLLSPGAAHAQVTLTAGNNPVAGQENVLLNTGDTGTTVFGVTQQSGYSVAFSVTDNSLEGTLTAPANGQARVEATDGNLNNVGIQVKDGSFTSLIFNANSSTVIPGFLNISVNWVNGANSGTAVFNNVSIGNGSNFNTLTVSASNPSTIFTNVVLTSTGGFQDLRQVRIGGAASTDTPQPPQALVPEPSAIAMALPGMFPMGLMFLRRRKKARSA